MGARLKDLKVKYISLVDSPATGEEFTVIKNKKGKVMDKELKELLDKYAPEEDIDALEDAEIPEEVQKNVLDKLKEADQYDDGLTDELKKSFGRLALSSILPYAEDEEEGSGEETGKGGEDEVEGTGSESGDNSGVQEVSKSVKKITDRLDQMDEDLDEAMEVIGERLDKLEEVRGMTKSLPEEEEEEGDGEGKEKNDAKWPSFFDQE